MEIIIKGGSKNLKEKNIKTMDNGNEMFAETVACTRQVANRGKSYSNNSRSKEPDYSFEVVTNKRNNSSVIVNEGDSKVEVKKKEDKSVYPQAPVVTEVVSNNIVKETKAEDELTVNGVNPKAVIATSPFIISEDVKEEFKDVDQNNIIDHPVENIEKAIETIRDCLSQVKFENIKVDLIGKIFKVFYDSSYISKELAFDLIISTAANIINDLNPEEKFNYDKIDVDFEKILYYFDKVVIDRESNAIKELTEYITNLATKIDNLKAENVDLAEKIKEYEYICNESNDYIDNITAENEDLKNKLNNITEELSKVSEEDIDNEEQEFTDGNIVGIKTFSALTVDIRDLLPSQQESQKIVVLVDKNGKYTTVNNLMLAIDEVDGISIEESEFVSKEYINDLIDIVDRYQEDEDELDADTEVNDSNIDISTRQFLESENDNDSEDVKMEV